MTQTQEMLVDTRRGSSRRRLPGRSPRGARRLGRRAGTLLAGPVLAVASLAGALPPGGSAAAAPAPTAPVGQAVPLPRGAAALGPRQASAALSLQVVLASRDPAALAAFLQQVYDPASPEYHHFLARGQFGPRFGAAPATVAAVEAELRAQGLHPGPVSSNDLLIPVSTTVAGAEAGFGTRIERYRLPSGRVAYANTAAPRLPASVAAAVADVVGLSDVARLHPALVRPGFVSPPARAARAPRLAAPALQPRTAGPTPTCPGIGAATGYGAYTANQLASAYGFDAGAYADGLLGAGETVALFELEPFAPGDLSAYEQCYGVSPTVNVIPVNGGAGTGTGQGEAALDVEDLAGLVPGAAIDVYETQNDQNDALAEYNRIASDDTAQVVSTSWGECEAELGPTAAADEETIFEQMAAQGQSLVAAAGDSGSEDCYPYGTSKTQLAVDDPASDPYVTGVGGTSLTAPGPPPTESAWNDGVLGGSGGGGISSFWTMPSWQQALGVGPDSAAAPCGAPSGSYCREVPDVSASADPNHGYAVYYSGDSPPGWQAFGGTSGAAPLWAAAVALADEACGAGARAGLLTPSLYQHAADLHDVTTGNNDMLGDHAGLYPAGPGYDMATGLGTPTAAMLTPGVLCASTGIARVSVSASNRQAGAPATWTAAFTTGPAGALAAGSGTITLSAPPGTGFPTAAADYTVDGTAVPAASVPGNGTVTLTTPVAIGNGTAVTVVAAGVTNPAAAADPAGDFSVATSTQTSPADAADGLSFGSGVANVSLASSTAVAAGQSAWTVGFTTSATGALGAGDTVTVTAPASTGFPSAASDYTVDGVPAEAVSLPAAGTAAVTLSRAVAGGTSVSLAVADVTDPVTGTYPGGDFAVQTTADAPSSPAAGLSFATGVTGVTVAASDRRAGAAATWTVGFTTSATGGLPAGSGTVDLTLPPSTTLPASAGDYTVDGTAATAVSVGATANHAVVTVPAAVAAGTAVTVQVAGVANPPAGDDPPTAFAVRTSADTTDAEPATGLSFGSGVTAVSMATGSTTAGVTTTWAATFTTSATGALAAGDAVTVAGPPGTLFPTATSDYSVGGTPPSAVHVSGDAVDLALAAPIGAGTTATVQLGGVGNPPSGTYPASDFSVATTADAAASPATGATFTSSVTAVTVTASDRRGGQAATWTFGFTTSAYGSLAAGSGTISLVAPPGAVLPPAASDYTVAGTAAATVLVGSRANTVLVTVPAAVAAGTAVTVQVAAVANPPEGVDGPSVLAVATSSDTVASHPATGLVFGGVVAGVSVSPGSTLAGATSAWTVTFDTSADGALAAGDTITVQAPAATAFASATATVDGSAPAAVSSPAAGELVVTLAGPVPGGAAVTLVAGSVAGPPAGAYPGSDFSVQTTADSAASPAAGLTFTGPAAQLAFTAVPSSMAVGGRATVVVSVEDSSGRVVTSDGTTAVGLAVTSGTGAPGATLTCAADPVTAAAGVAAFSCSIGTAGSGYTLTATASGLPSAVSGAFDVTSPPPAAAAAPPAGTGTAVTVTSSANPATAGTPVLLTATVAPAPDGGTVTFTDDGAAVAGCTSVPVAAGTATCTTSFATAGTFAVTARYSGDATYAASTSGPLSQAVDAAAPTTTTVTVSPASVTRGTTVTFSATVRYAGTAPGATAPGATAPGATAPGATAVPTGRVTFTTGSTTLCSAPLSPSPLAVATCTAASAPVGTDVVTGTYGGDATGAPSSGTATLAVAPGPAVAPAGYWLVGADGSVYAFGDAGFHGSLPQLGIRVSDIVAIAATPDGGGYWLVGADGSVYAFGDAGFHGSLPQLGVRVSDIVGVAVAPGGGGYWLVGADGGIFGFGDAAFHGSLPQLGVRVSDVVGVASAPGGGGYWLVGADGGVFGFGDAGYFGSVHQVDPSLPAGGANAVALHAPVTAVVGGPGGRGYWLVGADGSVFGFGDAGYFGSTWQVDPSFPAGGFNVAYLGMPVVAMAAGPAGAGYWLVGAGGQVLSFGSATYQGSLPGDAIAVRDVVGAAVP